MTTLRINAIAPDVCKQLRECDDAGQPPVLSVDETGGAPLRCCLTRALPGDRIALVSYAPLHRWAAETGAEPGPYDERGPVFLHAEECTGPAEGWPTGFHTGARVLRAYDREGRILRGVPVEPETAEAAAVELLGDQEVAVVHVRALAFGCFMHEVGRA
ncbi:DUF1203 domain-containing protein [Kitasatospora atroaurantiaca]|uniref:Uncharacterized protein DUF1203 n=1 Tax=Kitasatospora atroaurantiaca TaxID=285545 RepID=A0A561EUD9_9ACTN|nr:DUF1203 domain-containing protein [Kitasatospora atroaurantiaca]TWE19229.1 uncharacterized protein DUF1203 [Kitasatospora atroaurantiaca]